MLSKWLYVTVIYAELVIVNHDEVCIADACKSWCALLYQWMYIMVSYIETVTVNHGELC